MRTRQLNLNGKLEGAAKAWRLRQAPVSGGRLVAVAATAALMLAAMPGRADEKQACITASDKAQQAKLEGKLQTAREQLLLCSRNECPGLVRQDCAQWMTEVIAALPSVVIGARDWQGHDVFAVKVSVDGVLLGGQLNGKPFPVDPGVHTFKYESPSVATPVEERVLIREGEKNRNLTVQFPAPAGAQPASTGTGSDQPVPATESHGPSPLAYVFTGVGVVALGAALVLELAANSQVSGDRSPTGCAPTGSAGHCSASEVTSIQTKWYAAGTSLGLGLVSLGVATYFFIARPSDNAQGKHSALWIDFAPAPRGGVGQLVGHF